MTRPSFLALSAPLLLLLPGVAAAQEKEGTQTFTTASGVFHETEVSPTLQVAVYDDFDGWRGGFGLLGQGQAVPYLDSYMLLVGPTFTVPDGDGAFIIGLIGGLENGPQDVPGRGMLYLEYAQPEADFVGALEHGVSGFGYQGLLRIRATGAHPIAEGHIGLVARRSYGEGIYFDIETTDVLFSLSVVEAFEDRYRAKGRYLEFIRAEAALTYKTSSI